jgi:hypothetical protein
MPASRIEFRKVVSGPGGFLAVAMIGYVLARWAGLRFTPVIMLVAIPVSVVAAGTWIVLWNPQSPLHDKQMRHDWREDHPLQYRTVVAASKIVTLGRRPRRQP